MNSDRDFNIYINTLNTKTNNVTNKYRGSAEEIVKAYDAPNGVPEPGRRDSEAGIQYYAIDTGVNRRTMIPPVIGPRLYDQDVWGKSETVFPGLNRQTYRDITESELSLDDMIDRVGTRHSIGVPQFVQPRQPGSRVPQNYVGEPVDQAYYNGAPYYYEQMNRKDFEREIVPQYKGDQDNIEYWTKLEDTTIEPRNPKGDQRDKFDRSFYEDLQILPTNETVVDLVENNFSPPQYKVPMGGDEPDFQGYNFRKNQFKKPLEDDMHPSEMQNKKEHFAFITKSQPVPYGNTSDNLPRAQVTPLTELYQSQGTVIEPTRKYYDVMDRVPPGVNIQATPNTDALFEQSPTYVYTDDYFKQPQTRLYLQDVQPKLYSYAVDPEPINSNVGITYAPQRPPMILDQITDSGLAQPLYTRIDPQLLRTDGTAGQLARNPERTNWSSEYSDWQPAPGTINFENIYDPRFTSYGDPYRSYSDVNLGQVQYYYSDIDAYTRPNFITRSNVDFIDFRDPMGKVKPYYNRTASVDDVRRQVENQTMADELFHRQDRMESLMSKRNSEMYQLRYAPLSKAAHSNQGYGPSS